MQVSRADFGPPFESQLSLKLSRRALDQLRDITVFVSLRGEFTRFNLFAIIH